MIPEKSASAVCIIFVRYLSKCCVTSSTATKFSAASAEERERAVTQTLQTIDLAGQLNAPFVVLHLGEVNMTPITERLIAMAKTGGYLSREYVRMKIRPCKNGKELRPNACSG